MNRWAILTVIVLAPIASAQEKKAAFDQRWTPTSITVGMPIPAGEKMRLLREPVEGTSVAALLELPLRFIVDLDPTQSKIESYTDDKGTNLLKADGIRIGAPDIGPSDFASAGSNAKIVFRARGVPAPGATRIKIKGKVAIAVGKDEKGAEQKNVSLKKGVDLEIGSIKLPDRDRPGSFLFNSATYRGTRPLKSVIFLDDKGDEIAHRQNTSSILRNTAKGEFTTLFSFTRAVDQCSVRAFYFDTVETVIIPVELDVGLGFEPLR